MNETERDEREITIAEILDIEVRMFLAVPARQEPECRSHIDRMRLHRSSQFAGWSAGTCRSYLEDLRNAEAGGRNLMTLKYARMEGSIPPVSTDPRIAEIVEVMTGWQIEFIESWPNIMKGGRDINDFRNYLSGELETYSAETLALLKADVDKFLADGRSMTAAIYERMAKLAGYASLEALEAGI